MKDSEELPPIFSDRAKPSLHQKSKSLLGRGWHPPSLKVVSLSPRPTASRLTFKIRAHHFAMGSSQNSFFWVRQTRRPEIETSSSFRPSFWRESRSVLPFRKSFHSFGLLRMRRLGSLSKYSTSPASQYAKLSRIQRAQLTIRININIS